SGNRLVLDLNDRGDISGCIGWRWPRWHRWYGLHRLLLLAPSHECPERSQACKENYSGHHSVPVMRFVGPPKQHEYPDVKPDCRPNEIPKHRWKIALSHVNRVKQAANQKNSGMGMRTAAMSPIASPPPRVAPVISGEGAAIRGAGSGQGCARQQHR